jgi:acyl transferase domain-containing protein
MAKARDIRGKRLKVSHAFHSACMDPVLDEFEAAVERVNLRTPCLPLFSNLTGKQSGDEILRSVYWRRHLREPVLFQHGLASLLSGDDEPWILVEAGPGSALCAAAMSAGARAIASIPRGNGEYAEFLTAAAHLFVEGITLDWRVLEPGARGKVVLPTYPFQRKRYWIADTSRGARTVSALSATPVVTVEWERVTATGDDPLMDAGPFLVVGGRQAAAIADRLRTAGQAATEIRVRDDGSLAEPGVLEDFTGGTVVHAAGFETGKDFEQVKPQKLIEAVMRFQRVYNKSNIHRTFYSQV